ncbi:hypothetical protein TNCV_462111 [Trichonephila clavipes]|uniref:Uncharacterized protein n=2 Tax=Trichonephila clavipes TaxID=2585209 RepID=A0A8X6R1G8_TRICX|nr:hypothetical protein TNCV_462111 [Trichonephila clavipes]
MPSTSSSVSTISTSSSSTQENLLPSPSAIIPTIQKTETRSHTTPDKLNALSTENLPESVPTTYYSEHSNAAEIPQFIKRNSRSRRKRPKCVATTVSVVSMIRGFDMHNYSAPNIAPLSKKRPRIAFPARLRHALLAKDLVTWQAMVGRHILEDIVGRVAQYVDEHYPVDKWHLGDLIAWVAQSALKYRPRICELSKCLEGPLKMIVCPKKLLPTLSHLVKLLYAARQ